MLKSLSKFHLFLKKPQTERDAVIRKNVVGSLIFQFFSNVLGLLVVPLSLSYLSTEKYGIWINASVMVTWLQNMNLGMGFGMQNKVAEALAKNEMMRAKDYVTIVYRISTLIALGLLIVGCIASYFINWNILFNSSVPANELRNTTLIAFACFLVYFILGNIVPLFNALQKSQVPKLFALIANFITLLFLFTINQFGKNDLAWASLALAIPIPIIYLLGNLYYFRKRLAVLKPAWKIAEKKHIKDVFSLGVKFFLMQLTTLILTQAGVFIITQYIGPEEVTPFNVIGRYFYFGFFIFNLAITPYWAGFTEAYVKKDFNWIQKALRQLLVASTFGSLMVLIMLAGSFWLIPIWTKNAFDMESQKLLTITAALHIIIMLYTSVVSVFLNGISLLNYQLMVQVASALIMLAVSILLIKFFDLGGASVNIAMSIAYIVYLAFCGYKVHTIIKTKEKEFVVS